MKTNRTEKRDMFSRMCAVLAAFIFITSFAQAGVTVYNSRADWETAVGGIYAEEFFDDAVLNPGLGVVSSAGSASGGVWNDRLEPGGATTTWSFGTKQVGCGGNWDLSVNGAGTGIKLFLNGVAVSQEIPNSITGGFFGLVSTISFDTVLLTCGTQAQGVETYTLDNLVYSSVPEPATLSLLALGGLILRRKSKRA